MVPKLIGMTFQDAYILGGEAYLGIHMEINETISFLLKILFTSFSDSIKVYPRANMHW